MKKAPSRVPPAIRMGLIEAAHNGTLFLDEIGELPLAAQARLLRFIQEGEIRRIGAIKSTKVDIRLICATHRPLDELAHSNLFRQDLYYRINVLRLDIPPLRHRGTRYHRHGQLVRHAAGG